MDAYQSMVNLLFLLRRPKLAEVLNPEVFHEQLTASLPELDLTLVKEGADRLDMLERMRGRIDGLVADREAALAFGEVYARYVQRLGHERATRLLDADRQRREVTQAQADLRAEQDSSRRSSTRTGCRPPTPTLGASAWKAVARRCATSSTARGRRA